MVQREPNKTEQSSPPNLIPAELVAMGKQRLGALVDAQTELLERLREANRNWLDRVQSEANLAAELASKLTAARSIPETTTAVQEWTDRRMEMATDDAKRLIADAQTFMQTGARLWSNGWQPNGRGGISA